MDKIIRIYLFFKGVYGIQLQMVVGYASCTTK